MAPARLESFNLRGGAGSLSLALSCAEYLRKGSASGRSRWKRRRSTRPAGLPSNARVPQTASTSRVLPAQVEHTLSSVRRAWASEDICRRPAIQGRGPTAAIARFMHQLSISWALAIYGRQVASQWSNPRIKWSAVPIYVFNSARSRGSCQASTCAQVAVYVFDRPRLSLDGERNTSPLPRMRQRIHLRDGCIAGLPRVCARMVGGGV